MMKSSSRSSSSASLETAAAPPPRTGILRAEVTYGSQGAFEIACALELTEETVFVITDALPGVGTTVEIRLSLSHVIAPITADATVEQVRLASGPGTPSGFVARFAENKRGPIRALVERLSASSSPSSSPLSSSSSSSPGRKTPTTSAASSTISVLLVEDNALVRDMFAYAVEKYFTHHRGHVALEQASDVAIAWEKLGARAYDFAIVDYYLPNGGDGASLIARMRAEQRFATTSVIAVSVGGSDARKASLLAGADIFLHKPIILRDLFHTLELVLREKPKVAINAGA